MKAGRFIIAIADEGRQHFFMLFINKLVLLAEEEPWNPTTAAD